MSRAIRVINYKKIKILHTMANTFYFLCQSWSNSDQMENHTDC